MQFEPEIKLQDSDQLGIYNVGGAAVQPLHGGSRAANPATSAVSFFESR